MNSREFFDAVVKLRELQKSYIKVRTSTALTACKRQEKMIDEEIVRVKGKVEKDGQLRLLK
ncbi:hypothetical protein NXW10_13245 [Bacteroides fragilis]|nr:hypothetical protein NXW10_13245 [Bacteroides fragilis]